MLGLGLLATLCAAADETLSPTKPSDNALLYFAGDYKTYEFEVLNNNSRVEFRVTLTETANDVLDVYMNYGTPVNDTLAGSGLWAPDPAFTGAPEYTVTSGPVVQSTSNEGGADCSAGSTCMLYVIFVRRPLELTIADRGKILRKRPTMQNIKAMTEKVRFQAPNLPIHILYVCVCEYMGG